MNPESILIATASFFERGDLARILHERSRETRRDVIWIDKRSRGGDILEACAEPARKPADEV